MLGTMHQRRLNGGSKKAGHAAIPAEKDEYAIRLDGGKGLRKASSPLSRNRFLGPLALFMLFLGALDLWRHGTLPTPVGCSEDTVKFSECNARETIRELAHTIGMRLVGTKQEAMARDMIVEKLYHYKEQAKSNPYLPVFDIDVQLADGSHRFEILGEAVLKTYTNITNIVARISCGPECNENAVLMNSHFDSTIVSPGASDDGAGVAVMLEILRLLSQRQKPLKNAVIFLWNGAEETLQDASHAFITQHPYRDTIRGVINLEAMGQSGKEILFQANSKVFINAYAKVPHPHGSVLSNDIFRTGLVMADTDFGQFVTHGGIAGLDMAFYTNSYLYHTMLDVEDTIEKGSIQNFGENAMAILDHLIYEADIADVKIDNELIFFDILGLIFIHYTWADAHILHAVLILISLFTVFGPFRPTSFAKNVRQTLVATGSVATSFIGSVVFSLAVGGALHFGLQKPMVWYGQEWYPLALYAPLGLLGIFTSQYVYRSWSRTTSTPVIKDKRAQNTSDAPDAEWERTVFNGTILFFCIGIAVTDHYQLGFAYVLSIKTAALLFGRIVDIALTSHKPGGGAPLHPAAYFVVSIPFALTVELAACTLNLFVPISGRSGADTPVDIIVSFLAGYFVFAMSYPVVAIAHRFGVRSMRKTIWGLAVASVIAVAVFLTAVKPFDRMHPKRIFIEYKENVTDGTREVMLAHSDPALFAPLLALVSAETGSPPIRRSPLTTDRDWASLYPFSHFLESYSFNVSHLAPTHPAQPAAPDLVLDDDTYDAETDTRTLNLRCHFPQYIWTVLTFHATVVDWSLKDKSLIDSTQHKRYMIRNAGGYGTNSWTLSLRVKGHEKIAFEINGLERDGFHELVDHGDNRDEGRGEATYGSAVGPVKVGRPWKWTDRFGSAQVLARIERVMPEWTAGLYIGVVVRRFEF
ncbi:uncharacterized protein EV422DRAFT_526204 [Fimicolochytrium jonesii]|uniref:uncharacterized protein n=1 Tax=Fimicolochytrium jonesii TaxID=1396493 RepID=UPI0022FE6EB7|nr:uncharacterized protein EV422DRAFT_526204 [Fimicolochytrium jonesii]KAI8822253.1 hypothetical protein EV422DRAFT_526204 [Fimicolochytrium jonesii]